MRRVQVASEDLQQAPSTLHKADAVGLLPPWVVTRLCDTFADTQREFALHAGG
jgi:hypothetical protein